MAAPYVTGTLILVNVGLGTGTSQQIIDAQNVAEAVRVVRPFGAKSAAKRNS